MPRTSDAIGVKARYPRLDGLRCFAILLVMVEHFGWRGESVQVGYYGVDLFFVISGFLITGILLGNPEEKPGKALVRFMGRRALRIFPPYYLLICVLLIFGIAPARELSLPLLTYTFNYAATLYNQSHGENPLYYLWSLSVEEQFYLVWPPLMLVLRRQKLWLLASIAAVVLIGYAQLLWNIVPAMTQFNYTGLFNRMGSLGLGGLGAAYISWKALPKAVFLNRWVETVVFCVLVASLTLNFQFRFVLMGFCSLFLVIKAAHFEFQWRWVDRTLTMPAVVYVGMISYGVYLCHVPLGNAFTIHVFDPVWKSIPFSEFGALEKIRWNSWLIKLPLYSAMSIALAAASHRWFESPILRLKDCWFSVKSKPTSTPD